ncbi:hypothetical protein [Anabaena sp. 4-3]|uniref:hypothetical protein n=1 Tax=Anabaena sp. 4-3 TaxID=1811979 RepID=UPI000A91BD44|nr:hypothetical protein [Anabaena sp. 4-3]
MLSYWVLGIGDWAGHRAEGRRQKIFPCSRQSAQVGKPAHGAASPASSSPTLRVNPTETLHVRVASLKRSKLHLPHPQSPVPSHLKNRTL